jgi:P4 family phage/plasmid primase-like protien
MASATGTTGVQAVSTLSPPELPLPPFDLKGWLAVRNPERKPGIPEPDPKGKHQPARQPTKKAKAEDSGAGVRFPHPGITVFDDFAAKTDWLAADLLGDVKVDQKLADGEIRLTRPGKDEGTSGTIGHGGRDLFHCFSSNWAPFEDKGTYTKFQVHARLHHGGDEKGAARALSSRGYGTWLDRDGSEHPNPPPTDWGQATKAPAPSGRPINLSELACLPFTDTGNAERMIARHGQNLRYCQLWKKWLCFDGRRWAADETLVIRRLAKATARGILVEAATVEDKGRRESLIKWARATEGQKYLNNMIAAALAEEGVSVLPKDLNTDPWLLNVRNGTLDLRTGQLRAHQRDDLITALAPVEFHPDAVCPLWDATLQRFFAANPKLIAFWDRLCGIALTGVVSEQILPILHGLGDNGKTTMVGALLGLLGPDYSAIAPPGLVMVKRGESHPTERVYLFNKRLVVDMESDEGARLNEVLIKQLTGSDPITARGMHQDFWTFNPTHKLWLCTNHKPVIKGTDHAIWRRPKLVPFQVAIPEQEKIKNFPTLLKAEYPGILARCVRGCLDWLQNGLSVPNVVSEATGQYRAEQDLLGDFIAEEMTVHAELSARAGQDLRTIFPWDFSDLS